MKANPPKLFVISAPSGTGKTSVFSRAREVLPTLTLSVSCTTRSPRSGEQNGVDYYFISREIFKKRIKHQDFIEWAEVFGNYYGTSKSAIQENHQPGDIIVLDIDVQGTLQLMEKKDIEATYIFITPPSLEVLKDRLSNRGTESAESLKKRLGQAEKELSYKNRYHYSIENNDLETAVDSLLSIIIKEHFQLTKNTTPDIETILKKLNIQSLPDNQERIKNIISNILKTD
ncbi:MAG: guanylate kinase [Deltaproteobacteria bacterium]|jgi:guanylate kinase|nr:guanylate kinase [Deltaproteobacteria bacterium]MBT4527516.1 guanylate kinase [Deltaproteobacteria bacterium]